MDLSFLSRSEVLDIYWLFYYKWRRWKKLIDLIGNIIDKGSESFYSFEFFLIFNKKLSDFFVFYDTFVWYEEVAAR